MSKSNLISFSNKWTGGQYSLFRFIFGLYLAIHYGRILPYARELFSNEGLILDGKASRFVIYFLNPLAILDSPFFIKVFLILGILASLLFAIGFRAQKNAIFLWLLGAWLFGRNPFTFMASSTTVGWLLIVQAFLPRFPYGALETYGQNDPGSSWRMPQSIYLASWMVLLIVITYQGVSKFLNPLWLSGEAPILILNSVYVQPYFNINQILPSAFFLYKVVAWFYMGFCALIIPLCLFRKLRPWVWLCLLFFELSSWYFLHSTEWNMGFIFLLFFTLDPGWIPAIGSGKTAKVFYDGHCGLCHRAVRFILSEDLSDIAFKFSPLQGTHFEKTFSERERQSLPDSIVLVTPNGDTKLRSESFIYILKTLGGLWRAIGVMIQWIPIAVRDGAYDIVAFLRHALFPQPKDVCPMIPPHLRSKFDL